ncbi:flagellar biosynthetic protein FliR [Pseudogemmobacter sp. W21_MBD1_M6]|uniref:flagellar biosynthetic protein FliR n=1 Tax=Pseudogemmobacter sp. W21_MBD1_M6 TaxID=3240271 RepID=UPI003F96B386
MTSLIDGLGDLGLTGLQSTFIVFLRVGSTMFMLPVFGENTIPQRVRLGIALCFTAIVTPAVSERFGDIPLEFKDFPRFLGSEVIAGLALGISLRLFVITLQITGSIAAQSTSLSQVFGGAGMEPQPVVGHLLVWGGLALAAMAGLHVRAAEAMIMSYEILPAGALPDAGVLLEWGVGSIAHTFSLGFTLASPFVLASTVYNVAMGVINRAMPQLMVAMVGAPAIIAGSLILMMLALPLLLSIWIEAFHYALANPFQVPR